MQTASRHPLTRPALFFPVVLWSGALAFLAVALFLVLRSCGYALLPVASYAFYFALHVVLPGAVVLYAVNRAPLSLTVLVALGIPTGFAVEVATFLACSALQAKAWLGALPLGWAALGAVLCWRRRQAPVRWRLSRRHAGVALALSALFLCTVTAAVCQMFAESPLVTGLPQRPIFHDWVYLVSRAAAIKQHWPIEDPSLAGTPLQYHYFMMVHAAAASWGAKVELTLVMLRLMIVPLGAVLVAQAFALGRLLSRRAWGGVLAALLTVCGSGISLRANYGETDFLDLFTRWLYVSPTFYFGVIFFGALLLAVARFCAGWRPGAARLAWLGLLAAAGTGAKGTVLPVLLLGLALWAAWRWLRERRLPRDVIAVGLVAGAAFGAVYFATMAAWGAGTAAVEPFRVYDITHFWQDYAVPWQRALKRWLHAPALGTWLGKSGCALAVLAGTLGVRLLAIPYLLRGDARHRAGLAGWLGAVALASVALGTAIHFDANGELYLILLMRLPMAVLAGAFLISVLDRFRAWRRLLRAGVATRTPRVLAWAGRSATTFAVASIAAALLVQAGLWVARSRAGFADWLRITPQLKINDDLTPLYHAMLWVRKNTEPNAVLIANAFTPRNLATGRGVLVDHTTAGVHYYYSALSERRLWVEGPSYQLDEAGSRARMVIAARLFYHGEAPRAALLDRTPCYVLLDHSVGDGAKVPLARDARVFANGRFEIFRLVPPARFASK